MQNSLPHWRCIRLYLPQRRITRLIRAAKAAHLLLKEKAFIVLRFVRNLDVLPSYRYPLRLIHALNQRPRGTPILIGAGRAQHDRRGKAGSERRKACFHPGGSGFHLPRGAGGQGHSQFYSIDFHVTNRFFVSFLVRPALLPCGKRGFRAAICKIARPQPPAAAL